jgi:hypothetical protein
MDSFRHLCRRRKAAVEATTDKRRPVTGTPGTDGERRAANRLADELRDRGRAVAVQAVSVRLSEGSTVALHGLLMVGAGLLGIASPLAGAVIGLAIAFSYYAERALGNPLLGRVLPVRASQNVISPPPGPAWNDVEVVLASGYDISRSYPVGEWLSRRFSGRLTTDRIVFWAGMVPVFLSSMLYLAGIDGLEAQVVQLFGSTVLLAMVAAQFDARLTGEAEPDARDLFAADEVLAALDELLDEPDSDPPVAVCFFGAETSSSGGAAAFFGKRSPVTGSPVVVNLVAARSEGSALDRRPLLLTAREGDLATLKMSYDLGSRSEFEPKRAILRRATAALNARRRGLAATTVVGSDERVRDLALDVVENALNPEEDDA